jgi:hypothetical protein
MTFTRLIYPADLRSCMQQAEKPVTDKPDRFNPRVKLTCYPSE